MSKVDDKVLADILKRIDPDKYIAGRDKQLLARVCSEAEAMEIQALFDGCQGVEVELVSVDCGLSELWVTITAPPELIFAS